MLKRTLISYKDLILNLFVLNLVFYIRFQNSNFENCICAIFNWENVVSIPMICKYINSAAAQYQQRKQNTKNDLLDRNKAKIFNCNEGKLM